MAIALPLIDQLFMPVQQAVQWLSGAPAEGCDLAAPASATRTVEPRARSQVRPSAPVRPMRRWSGPSRSTSGTRPLRVVHIPEGRSPRGTAGRLLISGRFDDVFAELDRLARDHDTASPLNAATVG